MESELRDRRNAVVGGVLGLAVAAAIVCVGALPLFDVRALWLTVPFFSMWSSLAALVSLAMGRAFRGEDPLPELATWVTRDPVFLRSAAVVGGLLLTVLMVSWILEIMQAMGSRMG